MTEEDIKQFAAALAANYKRVKVECEQVVPRFINLDMATTSPEKFKALRSLSEKTYSNWILLADVITDLSLDIKQAFGREYELLVHP